MKRHGSKVLAVMLALALMGSTANAQAVTPSHQEQNRQLELQQAAARLQAAQAQQRGVGPGQFQALQAQLSVAEAQIQAAYHDILNLGQSGGAWWTKPALVARLGLTDEQKGRIERAFEANRQNIVSSTASLEKEEAGLARLLSADPIVRGAVLAQVDRVIQARGNMERTNAAMTLEMREQLTRAQWTQLQSEPTWLGFGLRVSRQELLIAPHGVPGAAPFPAAAPAPAGPGGRGGRGQQ